MFDRIAKVYDLLNTVMTAGLHHRWRERAADLALLGPGSRVLDVATGTGDLAIELARRVAPGGEVVGSDFSEAMLARARTKPKPAGAELRFEWGDALELPFADGTFDAATVGFGARNFSELAQGLREMVRVVRPAAPVLILDVPDAAKREACEEARRASGAALNPPHCYYPKQFFEEFAASAGRRAKISDQAVPGYANSAFRYNVLL